MTNVPGLAAVLASGETFVSGLLANYAAKPTTFEIKLPLGEILTFRSIGSYGEFAKFKREAAEYAEQRMKGHAHPSVQPYIVKEPEALISAYTIMELSVEPKFGEIEALQILGAPFIVEHIMAEIDRNRMSYLADGRNPLIEAKNESRQIPTSGSGSGSAETSTVDTPTS